MHSRRAGHVCKPKRQQHELSLYGREAGRSACARRLGCLLGQVRGLVRAQVLFSRFKQRVGRKGTKSASSVFFSREKPISPVFLYKVLKPDGLEVDTPLCYTFSP